MHELLDQGTRCVLKTTEILTHKRLSLLSERQQRANAHTSSILSLSKLLWPRKKHHPVSLQTTAMQFQPRHHNHHPLGTATRTHTCSTWRRPWARHFENKKRAIAGKSYLKSSVRRHTRFGSQPMRRVTSTLPIIEVPT